MTKSPETLTSLRAAIDVAIKNASQAGNENDIPRWGRWEKKKKYLLKQLRTYERLELGSEIPKRIFISYSKLNGQVYFDLVKVRLEEIGFSVVDGFQTNPGGRGIVLRNVLKQIESATIYLGIYTKEVKILDQGREGWSPSVWTIEEKGMALGLGKPVLLAAEQSIVDDFYVKTTGSFNHFSFNNYEHFKHEIADQIAANVEQKYYGIIEKSIEEDLRDY